MNKKAWIIIIIFVFLAVSTTGLVLGLTCNKTDFTYKVKHDEIYITGLKSPESEAMLSQIH